MNLSKVLFNFGPENTKATLQSHDSSYGGYPFKLVIRTQLGADKFKKLKKEERMRTVAFQLDMYLVEQGLNLGAFAPGGTLDFSRAKNGVKTATMTKFLANIPYAYGLAGELTSHFGLYKEADIKGSSKRAAFFDRLYRETADLKLELAAQKKRLEASGGDEKERERLNQLWREQIDTLKRHGISFGVAHALISNRSF